MTTSIRAAAACLLLAAAAWPQSFTGKISGAVSDSSARALAQAAITARNEETGAERRVLSDSRGLYVFPELAVGRYTLLFDAQGFDRAERVGVKVNVGAEAIVDAELVASTLQQTITVTAESPAVQRESGSLAELIGNRQVDSLPLNGRDYRKLTILLPGAAPRSPRGSLGSFTVNGQREKSNIFLIDGVDNNDSFRNQPSFNQGGVTGAQATILPVDAVAEFSLQTQGAAEQGRNSGAIVNTVLKSGTNALHGSAYEFLRHDKLNARNFFETLPGGQKAPFRNSNFGGTAGGAIRRDRTFFFAGYEGERGRPNSTLAVSVPSAKDVAAARTANQAAGRPENPLGATILNLFPQENNPGSGGNFVYSLPNLLNSDNFLVKLDHRFSDRMNLSGRYVFGNGNQTFPLNSGQGSELPGYQTTVPTRVQLAGVNLSTVLSDRLVAESRFSFNRFTQLFSPQDAGFDPASIGLRTGATGGLPTIVVSGFESLGAPTNLPRWRVSQAYQLADTLTWTHGAHTIKAGVDYRRPLVRSYNDQFSRGRISFNTLADLLAGVPAPSTTSIARGQTRRDTYNNDVAGFVQDDWKVTRRLSLNLGLRYEYAGPLFDKFDRISNFIPSRGLVQAGRGIDTLYDRDWNNFAPRAGFAFDATGQGRTVIRGSYGLYYDAPSQDFFLAQSFPNGNVGTNPVPGLGTFTVNFTGAVPFGPGVDIFGSASTPAPPFTVFGVDPRMRTPYIQSYTFNVQQTIAPGTAVQVGYVGSKGTRLYRVRDINQAAPGAAGPLQQRRPFYAAYPDFAGIYQLEGSANSRYDALQAYLRRPLAHNLTLFVSYVWSHSIDDASNGFCSCTAGVSLPQNSFDERPEKAASAFDQRQRLTAHVVYEFAMLPNLLPRWPRRLTAGWEVSGIYGVGSGLPITPFWNGAAPSGSGELSNDRPNVVGDPNAGPRTPTRWFNTAAFAPAAPGTFGNAGRNTVIGPRNNIADISLIKSTSLGERARLQFRAEFFNAFNHPNFALPNVAVNSSAFGSIASTPDVANGNPLGDGGPRQVQLALKLVF